MNWRVSEALTSVRRLRQVINDMTTDEVNLAIEVETESRRRKHILALLRTRAVNLYKLNLNLKEK